MRIGIAGCGRAARIHLARLKAAPGVEVVGLADPDLDIARALADEAGGGPPVFTDHAQLIREARPEALAVFVPHLAHYKVAMDALQAGCHLFVEKPLSTHPQEAMDIVSVARARGRVVAVGHQLRLLATMREARERLRRGEIGRVRLISALLASPWLASLNEGERTWRFDPRISGGGLLADAGDHLLDILLWTSGQPAAEVTAFQDGPESRLDVVTAAAVRLRDGALATIALSGVEATPSLQLSYHGESGRIDVDKSSLTQTNAAGAQSRITADELAATWGTPRDIDADFVAAVGSGSPPCCPAEDALETVRLLDGIARSAHSGSIVRLPAVSQGI